MKTNYFGIFAAFAALCLSSCSKDMASYQPQEKEPVKSTLSISFTGECVVDDGTPMSRAGLSDELYGINIYQKNLTTNKTTTYAYTVVDDISSPLSIELVDNDGVTNAYSIECSLLNDGKNLALSANGGYAFPFNLSNGETSQITNGVFSPSVQADGSTYVNLSNLTKSPVYKYGSLDRPFCERFYGSADIPAVGADGKCSVKVKMYRRYFGLNLHAKNLKSGAKITVQLEGAELIELTNTGEMTKMVSHKTINTAEDKVMDYSESVPVVITYYAEGDTEGRVMSDIKKTFKRNYLYSIEITDINGDDSNTTIPDGSNGISIVEEGWMGTDKSDVIWSSR